MQKRNLILLIVILVIIVAIVFAIFYFYKPNNNGALEEEGTNFLADFFPFGNKNLNQEQGQNTDISGYQPENEQNISDFLFRKVSSFPIAGYVVFNKERYKEEAILEEQNLLEEITGSISQTLLPSIIPTPPTIETVPALRYVEKSSGNVYQTLVDQLDERKISTTLIPQVHEAFFGSNGQTVIFRYLKNNPNVGQANKSIQTFVASLPKEILGADTSYTELKGAFLPENITDLSISKDTTQVFYLFNLGEDTIGTIANLPNENNDQINNKIQIFDSSFNEWLSGWSENKTISLNTKPSYLVPGYLYTLNVDNKKLDKTLGGIKGLTSLFSPDGKSVLYNDNNLSLKILKTDTSEQIAVNLKTLPEKCTWTKDSLSLFCSVPKYLESTQYPDTWYQAETSFSDEIWKINAENGSASIILDPLSVEGNTEEIDGVKLTLDEAEKFLFLINKKDSFLWELKLN